MTVVMGLDQHRAQVTADWLDTETGEVSRARVMPADRAGVRRFLARLPASSSRWRWKPRPDGGSWSKSSTRSAPSRIWPSRPKRAH